MLHDYLWGKVGDFIANTISRAIKRVRGSTVRDPDIQPEDIAALENVVNGIVSEIPSNHTQRAGVQSDRATDAFVVDAIESALASPFPAKHALLGRLIGQRFMVETESREDLFLREALRIVSQSNRQQLFALAVLYLVHHPPESLMPIESLRAWWDSDFLPLLERLVGDWNGDDLDYLERLGAVEIDPSESSAALRLGSRPGAPIDAVLLRRGFVRTDDTSQVHGSEFAIYASRLHAGTGKTTGWPAPDFALSPFQLTVPGRHVALTIIEGFVKYPIDAAATATEYPIRGGSGA